MPTDKPSDTRMMSGFWVIQGTALGLRVGRQADRRARGAWPRSRVCPGPRDKTRVPTSQDARGGRPAFADVGAAYMPAHAGWHWSPRSLRRPPLWLTSLEGSSCLRCEHSTDTRVRLAPRHAKTSATQDASFRGHGQFWWSHTPPIRCFMSKTRGDPPRWHLPDIGCSRHVKTYAMSQSRGFMLGFRAVPRCCLARTPKGPDSHRPRWPCRAPAALPRVENASAGVAAEERGREKIAQSYFPMCCRHSNDHGVRKPAGRHLPGVPSASQMTYEIGLSEFSRVTREESAKKDGPIRASRREATAKKGEPVRAKGWKGQHPSPSSTNEPALAPPLPRSDADTPLVRPPTPPAHRRRRPPRAPRARTSRGPPGRGGTGRPPSPSWDTRARHAP